MALTRRYRLRRLAGALLLFSVFPIAFLFKDSIENSPFPLCPFYAITTIHCPFCGLTRAFANAVHADFQKAALFHPAWWIAAAATLFYAVLFLHDAVSSSNSIAAIGKKCPWLLSTLGGIVFTVGIIRFF